MEPGHGHRPLAPVHPASGHHRLHRHLLRPGHSSTFGSRRRLVHHRRRDAGARCGRHPCPDGPEHDDGRSTASRPCHGRARVARRARASIWPGRQCPWRLRTPSGSSTPTCDGRRVASSQVSGCASVGWAWRSALRCTGSRRLLPPGENPTWRSAAAAGVGETSRSPEASTTSRYGMFGEAPGDVRHNPISPEPVP